MTDYLVTVNDRNPYSIGVDYEIPTKSIQYGNLILDEINSGFTGVGQTFALSKGGTPYDPINDQQLIVVKNNLVMEPVEDFTTSGAYIIFTTAPDPGDDVFIIALATTADLTRTVNYVVDSGSHDMLAGNKGNITIDVTGIIESFTILSDQVGDLNLNIKKSNYTDFPTYTSILPSNLSLSNTQKYRDDNLIGWDKTITAGDILSFDVVSVSGIRRFLISLKLKLWYSESS